MRPLAALPKTIFEAALAEGDPREGFVAAVAADGSLVLQLCVGSGRLATYTAERPPTMVLGPDAARELATAILRELAPDLAAALDAHERRSALRVVGSDGPEAA